MHTAIRGDLSGAGSYRISLNDAVPATTSVTVGQFCPIVAQAWELRSFDFVAPANAASLPVLVFAPFATASNGAYPGADEVSLTDVTDCR